MSSACDFGRHFSELGCGHSNFQAIRNAFSLHVTSEEAIVNNSGAFGRYFTRAGLKEIDSFGNLPFLFTIPALIYFIPLLMKPSACP